LLKSVFLILELDQDQVKNMAQSKMKMSKYSSVCKEVNRENHVDDDIRSFITDSHPKSSGAVPPPVAPRRSRQNSACSTQSSVRYVS
jgi:hypothetical protein